MKVVILAGGKGTRLAEETHARPKPMVEIGGRPILWHIMMRYAHHGHKDFYVALGYKGDVIKKYFVDYVRLCNDLTVDFRNGIVHEHDGPRPDFTVNLIDTGLETLTGGRVRRLRPHLDGDTFLMTYGDGVSDVDLDALVAFHRQHGKLATMTVVRPPARFGHVQIEDGRIMAFAEKPRKTEGLTNGGFFVLEPGIFDYIDGDDAIFEREPLENLARDGQLMAYEHRSFWQCMDTVREKELLESLWESGQAPWHTGAPSREGTSSDRNGTSGSPRRTAGVPSRSRGVRGRTNRHVVRREAPPATRHVPRPSRQDVVRPAASRGGGPDDAAPLVSVGMPVYNAERHLHAAVDSILAQTFRDFELILVDNASTDDTARICLEYAERDDRIRYVRNDVNIGASENFNKSLHLARGTYFKWAAADDLCRPVFLERCVELLEANPAAVLAFPDPLFVNDDETPLPYDARTGAFVDENGKRWIWHRDTVDRVSSPDPIERFEQVLLRNHVCQEIFGLVRRDALERTPLMKDYYGSDKVVLIDLVLQGPWARVPEPLFLRRCHRGQSGYLTAREREAWIRGRSKTRLFTFPQGKIFTGYVRALHRAGLDRSQRTSAIGVLYRYVARPHKLKNFVVPGPDNYFGIDFGRRYFSLSTTLTHS